MLSENKDSTLLTWQHTGCPIICGTHIFVNNLKNLTLIALIFWIKAVELIAIKTMMSGVWIQAIQKSARQRRPERSSPHNMVHVKN